VSGPSGAVTAPTDARTFPPKRLAQAGMVAAGLGVLLVIPPILIHNVAVPVVLAMAAALLGALAVRGGEARLGGLALFGAAVAGVSGVLFATTDTPTVRAIVTAGLFASTTWMMCLGAGLITLAPDGDVLDTFGRHGVRFPPPPAAAPGAAPDESR